MCWSDEGWVEKVSGLEENVWGVEGDSGLEEECMGWKPFHPVSH